MDLQWKEEIYTRGVTMATLTEVLTEVSSEQRLQVEAGLPW